MKRVIPILLLLLLLPGCFMASVEELLLAPQPPETYVELQPFIAGLLKQGYGYSAPLSGHNRQPIQIMDLGSGNEEAFVFLSQKGQPIRVCIYAKKEGVYEEICYIEEDSESIDSVSYSDIDGDGLREILLGWRTGGLKSLSVYSYDGVSAVQRLQVDYDVHLIADLTGDGINDLVVLRQDAVSLTGLAELYGQGKEDIELLSAAPLSQGVELITRVITGGLTDGKLAVLVASQWNKDSTVTDIIAYRNGELVNISLNEETQVSDDNVRLYRMNAADINNDGFIDIPRPVPLPVYAKEGQEGNYWCIEWCNYASTGEVVSVLYTYHNQQDGWYLELPDAWIGQITVTRLDATPGERAIVFALHAETPIDLLILHTTTARDASEADSRVVIGSHGDTTVLASFPAGNNASYVPSVNRLTETLKWIHSDWITGEIS